MIFWTGWGILVPIIPIGLLALVASIVDSISQDSDFFDNNRIIGTITALVAAGILWYLGNRFNHPSKDQTLLDEKTNQRVVLKPSNTFFFIPMQYWAFVAALIALANLIF